MATYLHGYGDREHARLEDQAGALIDLLHHDTGYPVGARALEAGCGVGAQTATLAARSPGARIVSMDISAASLAAARSRVGAAGVDQVTFLEGDIFALPFERASFDHIFVCFVLEHLARPVEAVRRLMTVLRPGRTMAVIEGDHGSAYFHPDDPAAHRAIQCLVDLQAAGGGDALIGRRLYPLMLDAGLESVRVDPRMVYADASRPAMVDGFTRKTFTAMVEGVRSAAIDAGIADAAAFDAGIAALYRTAELDGVFCYTFFKGVGSKPGARS